MRAVLMIIAGVFGMQPLQMASVHRDEMVQQVAAATFDPSFRDAVLPRAFERGSHSPDLQRPDRCGNLDPILTIPVQDQNRRSGFKWKRFPQLLDDPRTGRVFGNVEVQDAPTIMLMMKKQYSTPKVIVGTVKKSIAAIASR